MFTAPLAVLPEAWLPDLKIASHALYIVRPDRLLGTLTPQIFRFFTLFLKIFKNFFCPEHRHRPPCAESPRRTRPQLKNPGIPRQNHPSASRRRPKIARKMPLQSPERPAPHIPPRKKVE